MPKVDHTSIGSTLDLNIKQQRFCEEFLVDFNGTQAVLRAGYSKTGASVTASRLLRNPKVCTYIKQLKEEQSKRTEIDADYILNMTKKVVERCMQFEKVLDKEGNETGEYQFKENGALRGLEMLGKNQGVWNDNNVDFKELPKFVVSIAKSEDAGTE